MNRRLPRAEQTPAPTRRRQLALAGLGAATVLSLSACQWNSPIQTQKPYEPADGVSTSVGDVQVRNLLIVSGKAGGPGTLVGMLVNSADQASPVSISVAGGTPIQAQVPANGAAQLSTPEKKLTLPAVKEAPGAITSVQVSTPSGGSSTMDVPVLYPRDYYKVYAPSGWTPSAEPSATAPATGAH